MMEKRRINSVPRRRRWEKTKVGRWEGPTQNKTKQKRGGQEVR